MIPHGVVFKADCSGIVVILCLLCDAGFICALCRTKKYFRDRKRMSEREAVTEMPTNHGAFPANKNLFPLHPDARIVGFQITPVNFAQLPHA